MVELTRIDDIDQVILRFTDLGKTLAEISTQNQATIQETTKALQDGFQAVSSGVLSSDALQNLQGSTRALEASAGMLTQAFMSVVSQANSGFAALLNVAETSKTHLQDLSQALLQEKNKKPAGSESSGAEMSQDPECLKWKKQQDEKKKKGNQLPGVVRRELFAVKSKATSMAGSLKIPLPGKILGGLVGIMAYGFIEEDRIKKEAGEVKNALEGAVDFGIKGIAAKGTAQLSSLQESLQKYSGIAKEEVQSIGKTFAQGGVSIQEMMSGVDRSLGRVGSSAVAFTLGLDKMFELQGGTTAQKAVGFIHNYGMGLKDASETVKDLYLNEHAMKIGAPTFVHNIETAAEAVKNFGFGIRGVMDIAGKLQESFDNIGVPKQFAGKLAGLGVQQMAQGIAGLSNDWKVLVGRRMGMQGSGTQVVQQFEESFTRVKAGKSDEDLKTMVLAMYEQAKEATEGDESRMYLMLSQKMGMGSYGARAIMNVGSEMEKGGSVAAVKATAEHAKGLRDAFKTEKEKQGEFQRNMNQWMEGMSEVGQGLLGLVGKFLAHLVITFRMWPEMFGALISRDFERLSRMQAQAISLVGNWRADINRMKDGFSKMGAAGKRMFGDVFSSSIGAMDMAFNAPLTGDLPEITPSFSEADRKPIVKPVYIPVSTGGQSSVSLEPAAEAAAMQYAKKHGTPWVGGGPIIKTGAVSEGGDIEILLMGNCPRCGLIFGGGEGGTNTQPAGAARGGAFTSLGLSGEGKHTGQSVEGLARMIQTEAGGYRGNNANEVLGMLQTVMNRGGTKGGDKAYDIVTGGSGWGEQGKAGRQYGTKATPTEKTIEFVRKFLRGEVKTPDALKGATNFFHASKGDRIPAFAKKGKGGILGVEETRPGRRAFFVKSGGTDTAAGVQGREWISGSTGGGAGTKSAAQTAQTSPEAFAINSAPSFAAPSGLLDKPVGG